MYCENCGAKINDNEKFCPFCGAKTEPTEQTPDIPQQPAYQPPQQPAYQPPQPPAYQPPAYPQQPKPPAKSGMKAAVIVLAVLLAAAVVLVTLSLTGVLGGKKPVGGRHSAQRTDVPEPTPRHTEPGAMPWITPGTAETALPEPSEVPQTPMPTSGKTSVQDESVTVDLVFSSGTGVYTGEVDENGLPDGYGVFFMESDDYGDTWNYTGMWKHGHLCGDGVLESANGRLTISGNFRNDMLNGMGAMTLDGVLLYEGEYRDSEFWGYGKLYTESGILLFEGEFEDNQLKDASDRVIFLDQILDDYVIIDDEFVSLWPDDVETDDTIWALYGDIIAADAQYEDGIVILDVPVDTDEGYITVAVHYLYAVDEYRIDEEDDETLTVFGYYVGTYETDIDGVLTTIPKIDVLYWTTE